MWFFVHINAFLRKTINKAMAITNITIMNSNQRNNSVILNWKKNKYVLKRDLNDDNDGAH